MYRIRKSIGWICLAVFVILLLPSIDTFAENSAFHEAESKDYQLRYSETRKISAAFRLHIMAPGNRTRGDKGMVNMV